MIILQDMCSELLDLSTAMHVFHSEYTPYRNGNTRAGVVHGSGDVRRSGTPVVDPGIVCHAIVLPAKSCFLES